MVSRSVWDLSDPKPGLSLPGLPGIRYHYHQSGIRKPGIITWIIITWKPGLPGDRNTRNLDYHPGLSFFSSTTFIGIITVSNMPVNQYRK